MNINKKISGKLVLRKNLLAKTVTSILGLSLSAGAVSVYADEQAQDDNVEKIVVISTGIRGAERTVAESPAPIDIISGDALLKTGRAELSEAISKLLPSFNYGSNNAGINSVSRPLTNRSLAPAYTLVLVNGKRWHKSAWAAEGSIDSSGANAVDIDFIPSSAVDRIEVLKDSAAAQYGSDAIAGVINIILKDSDVDGNISASYGSLYNADIAGVTGKNRKFQANKGFALGEEGFIHFSADLRKRDRVINGEPATGNNWFAGDPKNDTWDRVGRQNGDPELDSWNLGYNAGFALSDTLALYSNTTYGVRKNVIGNNLRRANSDANIIEIFPDGYFPVNNIRTKDYQFLLGARGEANDWAWDISSSYGRNRNKHSSDLTLNPSLGPVSPTSFDDLATYQSTEWTNNFDISKGFDVGLAEPLQVSFGLEYRIEHFETFAASDPLAYAFGDYVYPATLPNGDPHPLAGRLPQQGTQGVVVLTPEDEADIKRKSFAAYVDFGLNPTENWYIGIAGRVEDFDDASGTTYNGKFNTRYDFTPEFAVRGTLGSGFRAPSLTQIGFANTFNQTGRDLEGNIVPSAKKLAPVDSDLARLLGAEDLEPEESWNIGLGFTWQPLSNLNLTVDSYQIEIKDRITKSEELYGPALDSFLVSNGFNLPSGYRIMYFANAFDTRTRGLDLVTDYTQRTENWGRIRWTAAFNYNKTTITSINETPAVLSDLAALGTNTGGNLTWIGRPREGTLTVASPRTKLVLGADWTIDDFKFSLQTTRYGSVTTLQALTTGDRTWGAKWITDLDVAYSLTDAVTISLGANNLFDVRPDKNGIVSNTGISLYGDSPFSPMGGAYYGKISYNF